MKILVFSLFAVAFVVVAGDKDEEKRARLFLEGLNDRTAKRNNRVAHANWAYASNITDENLQKQVGFTYCFLPILY